MLIFLRKINLAVVVQVYTISENAIGPQFLQPNPCSLGLTQPSANRSCRHSLHSSFVLRWLVRVRPQRNRGCAIGTVPAASCDRCCPAAGWTRVLHSQTPTNACQSAQ